MERKSTRILIVSDLHYVPEEWLDEETRRGRKLMQYARPLLERLVVEANESLRPDLVVNLGDLVQDYGKRSADVAAMQFIWRGFDGLAAPHATCVGNHDLRATRNRRETARALGCEDSTYSFDAAGLHVIVLGTDVNYEAQTADGIRFEQHRLSDEDLTWLERDLRETELPVIVCLHFGLAEDLQEGNYWFGTCPEEGLLANRRQVKEVLKRSGKVLAVFSGHQHWTKTIVEEGIPYFLVGSMTENIDGDGVPDGVYLVAETDGKQIAVTERHIRL